MALESNDDHTNQTKTDDRSSPLEKARDETKEQQTTPPSLSLFDKIRHNKRLRMEGLVLSILFLSAITVILVLHSIPIKKFNIDVNIETEYLQADVPGGMSGYGENYGRCANEYYRSGAQFWPFNNVKSLEFVAKDISLTIYDSELVKEKEILKRISTNGKFKVSSTEAKPFKISGWGIAGDTSMFVERIPNSPYLTIRMEDNNESGYDWWMPCILFESESGDWSLNEHLLTEHSSMWAYSYGPIINFKLELIGKDPQYIYSGKPLRVTKLQFASSKDFSPILGGTVKITNFDSTIHLKTSDSLDIDWQKILVSKIAISKMGGVHIEASGQASKVGLDRGKYYNKTPTLLKWFYTEHNLILLWSSIAYLFGLLAALFNWIKKF